MKTLLLHVCCAPCATQAIETLRKDYELLLYFYNPNIMPKTEYERRLRSFVEYAKKLKIKYVIGDYDNDRWITFIKGFENEKEGGIRCDLCFQYRLTSAALAAKNEKQELFSTTLTISPHKDSKKINFTGKKIGDDFKLRFLELDLKKQDGFRKSLELSKKHDLYRQDYCGCIYSLEERKRSMASPKE